MNRLEKEDKRFYESLFILYKCNQSINNLWSKINSNSKDFINGFDYTDTPLLYHIILEVVSFIEEYNGQFNNRYFTCYSTRITQVKEINKPIFKEINKWKLKDFRNNIVAHPWRYNGEFAHPDSEKYIIPKNALEFSLLINYMNYIWSLIEAEFKIELNNALVYMLEIANVPKRIQDYSNLNEVQLSLVKRVNEKCMELKKNYHLKVFLFDFSEIESK